MPAVPFMNAAQTGLHCGVFDRFSEKEIISPEKGGCRQDCGNPAGYV